MQGKTMITPAGCLSLLVGGGACGSADTQRDKSRVVKNRLRNRGYKILN